MRLMKSVSSDIKFIELARRTYLNNQIQSLNNELQRKSNKSVKTNIKYYMDTFERSINNGEIKETRPNKR